MECIRKFDAATGTYCRDLAYSIAETNYGIGRKAVNLPLIIRSHYYKALLVLLRRDRIIDARERDLMLKIGKVFDFDRRFCEAAIDELLSNVHITREPFVFPDEKIKKCFFRDALHVAMVDGYLHPAELRWLRRMAGANGRSNQWLNSLIRDFQEKKGSWDSEAPLEIEKFM
jgi:hypothetical protein